jgi:Flp pilus assembly protein TadD
MRMGSQISILAVALFLASEALYGQAPAVGAHRADASTFGYIVTGKVFLPDGKPAAGAKVEVACDFDVDHGVTDADGIYRITGIAGGSCRISVDVRGFEPIKETHTINAETTYSQAINVPLYLKTDPYKNNPMSAGVPSAALEKFKAGVEKSQKRDFAPAIKLFDDAIKLYPAFAAAYYEKGVAQLHEGKVADALAALVEAIRLKPDYVDAKYQFGIGHIQQRNFTIAEEVFRDVLKASPEMASAHMYLGIALIGNRRNDEAERELKQAVSLKGGEKLAMAHKYLGGLYLQKKQNAEAAAELQKYIELSPKAADAEKIKATIADLKKQG